MLLEERESWRGKISDVDEAALVSASPEEPTFDNVVSEKEISDC